MVKIKIKKKKAKEVKKESGSTGSHHEVPIAGSEGVSNSEGGKKDKHAGGRPLKFKSVKDLEKKIKEYFDSCYETVTVAVKVGEKKKGNKDLDKNIYKEVEKLRILKPITITGLALALDTSRQTLINYEIRPEFFDTIKRAKLVCENFAEEYLYDGKNVTGAIFNLKNNYDWKESQEVKHSGGISLTKLFEGAKEDE